MTGLVANDGRRLSTALILACAVLVVTSGTCYGTSSSKEQAQRPDLPLPALGQSNTAAAPRRLPETDPFGLEKKKNRGENDQQGDNSSANEEEANADADADDMAQASQQQQRQQGEKPVIADMDKSYYKQVVTGICPSKDKPKSVLGGLTVLLEERVDADNGDGVDPSAGADQAEKDEEKREEREKEEHKEVIVDAPPGKNSDPATQKEKPEKLPVKVSKKILGGLQP